MIGIALPAALVMIDTAIPAAYVMIDTAIPAAHVMIDTATPAGTLGTQGLIICYEAHRAMMPTQCLIRDEAIHAMQEMESAASQSDRSSSEPSH
eukprot:1151539-Pelagomonas_calceolata.AAC.3